MVETIPLVTNFIGIDPGVSGGIAWIAQGKPGAAKMPKEDKGIWDMLAGFSTTRTRAVIEKVHASPQMGVTSAFTFGGAYRAAIMALTASGIDYELVTPTAWQAALGVRMVGGSIIGADRNARSKAKKASMKAQAKHMFPKLRVTNYTADALLIAEYCRRNALGDV